MAETVHLTVDPALHGDLVTGTLALKASGEPITIEVTIPAGPTTTEDLMPVLHGLSDYFTARGTAKAERQGRAISCRLGCDACCHQLVGVSGAEARHLSRLVAAMPEPRRSRVMARFEAVLAALDAAGMLDRITDVTNVTVADQGLGYLRLGIPCPFLEDRACSIHPDRPLTCREFLVTSPAAYCATPDQTQIDGVELEWKFLTALIRAEPGEGWVPLPLALRHAAATPAPPKRSGPAIMSAVVATQQ